MNISRYYLIAFLAASAAGGSGGIGLCSRRGPAPNLRIEVVNDKEGDDAQKRSGEDLDERVEQRACGRHAGGDARQQIAVHADPTHELATL